MQVFLKYSDSIWRTHGRKWKKRGTSDCIRARDALRGPRSHKLHGRQVARCIRSCSHTLKAIEDPHMIEKFNKFELHKTETTNQEAQLMVPSGFQEISESERQAVISAQRLASSLQSEMSQATTACDFWTTKVIRLGKEVAEQNTKRITWETSSHCSSVHLPPSSVARSQPFTPTEKVEFTIFSRSDSQKAVLGNIFHRLPLLYRTRDRLPMKVSQKGEEQRNSNLNLGRKRLDSVLGKSLVAVKWYQDQLILDRSANG